MKIKQMRSKKEQEILEFLENNLDKKFHVVYENKKLEIQDSSILIDFTIFQGQKEVFYIEFSGMNFFNKYIKIFKLIYSFENCIVVFDNEKIFEILSKLIDILNKELDTKQIYEKGKYRLLLRVEKFNNTLQQIMKKAGN